jgi:hypothetical protein
MGALHFQGIHLYCYVAAVLLEDPLSSLLSLKFRPQMVTRI